MCAQGADVIERAQKDGRIPTEQGRDEVGAQSLPKEIELRTLKTLCILAIDSQQGELRQILPK